MRGLGIWSWSWKARAGVSSGRVWPGAYGSEYRWYPELRASRLADRSCSMYLAYTARARISKSKSK